jgi:ureidoglycolate hydrolase
MYIRPHAAYHLLQKTQHSLGETLVPRTLDVKVERLTSAAFRPFGQVLGPFDTAPVYTTVLLQSPRVDFDVEGRWRLTFTRYTSGPFEFELIERHPM